MASPPPDFLTEWREGDRIQKTLAVAKRAAPVFFVLVFIYVFTTFAGR